MKKYYRLIFIIIVFMVTMEIYCLGPDHWPVLKGPYLGQKPPGMIPEIFAPGILRRNNMGSMCTVFSPKGDEFYCCLGTKDIPGGIARMRMIDDVWTKPEMLPINSSFEENDMCMSYDGKRLIFLSWRPLPDGTKPERTFLWFSERTKNGWAPAKPLLCGGEPVKTGYPSISRYNTLYFSHRQGKKFGIFRSKLMTDGTYGRPEHVFNAIDSFSTEGDMFIAPDESYMIISLYRHPENLSNEIGDLYVVFKKSDGTWNKAINMGRNINTAGWENCPQVSPDGKNLFFFRHDPKTKISRNYWVDAKVFMELKPDGIKK